MTSTLDQAVTTRTERAIGDLTDLSVYFESLAQLKVTGELPAQELLAACSRLGAAARQLRQLRLEHELELLTAARQRARTQPSAFGDDLNAPNTPYETVVWRMLRAHSHASYTSAAITDTLVGAGWKPKGDPRAGVRSALRALTHAGQVAKMGRDRYMWKQPLAAVPATAD